MTYPESAHITEVGPRDGLQSLHQVIPTDTKIDLVASLAAAGLPAIQVASFVHDKRVPQMADAEAVVNRLPLDDGVSYSALALNEKGVIRAIGTAIPWIEVSLSVSESQSRVNSGMTVAQARKETRAMIRLAQKAGRHVRATIQCAFGCSDPDEVTLPQVLQVARSLLDAGVDLLVPADTAGMASPATVRHLLESLLPMAAGVPVGLHLHDTRGLGLANVLTALEMGVSHFDTSLGGLGGCPFLEGATGNIATEDTIHLLNSLGVITGIDIAKVSASSRGLSDILSKPFPGKCYRIF